MTRFAAVDLGSNSVRMMAADVSPGGKIEILAEDRQVTRLGAGVFADGMITPEAQSFVSENLRRMRDVFRGLEVAATRAVATSAVRDASNREPFLAAAAEALGHPIEIISGQEEARLIHLGVQSRWPQQDKRVLLIDVGGGSAEITFSDRGVIEEAYSKPLGAVRLTEVFQKHDPPSPRELHQLDEYIEEKLSGPVARNAMRPFDRAIATSATAAALVCAVNRIPRAKRDEADRLSAPAQDIRRFFEDIRSRDVNGRRKFTGVGPRRADIIIAGAAVFVKALAMFQQSSLSYSAAGVRDGIIADLASRGLDAELGKLTRDQRRDVEAMALKFGVQLEHARKVARLCHKLFAALAPLHKLAPQDGRLLEAAAYLHDIGHFVSDVSHHKHSYYLVLNSDLPGFTDAERQVIAALCRYHRKTLPTPRHAMYSELSPDARPAVSLLTPLLRIADSLDRGHEQRVHDLNIDVRNGNVLVGLESSEDADLELWAAERVADSFRQAYQIPLVLTPAKP